jgi:hypothetical protein
MENCQHFVLPDNGRIFADNCKGLINEKIELPYPAITIEYFVDLNGYELKPGEYVVQKKVCLVIDLESMGIPESILVMPIACRDNRWLPYPYAVEIEKTWDRLRSTKNEIFTFTGKPVLVMDELIKKMEIKYKISEKDKERFMQDAMDEAVPVLELLEALSCKNIKPVIFQEASKVNSKREKSGKTPIWETKILEINASYTGSRISTGRTIQDRKSPSQHLRRGHPRRLANGDKIWINNTIVGNPKDGVINKNYKIK